MTISGFPNIRVIIREAEDENLTLDVPNINVIVEKDADYNVNVTPAAVVPMRTGSYQRFADVALLAYTASYVSASGVAISSSYALTASYAETTPEVFPYSGSAVITGSLIVSQSGIKVTGSVNITDNLTVEGIISAERLLVSSSVIYESGSTKFGDSPEDTHEFTGSLLVQGPISASGITGSLYFETVTQDSQFQIPFISQSKLSIDIGTHLTFNPVTHDLKISGGLDDFAGIALLSPRGISITSGANVGFIATTHFGAFTRHDGKVIGIAANPSSSNPRIANINNPVIFITSGSLLTTAYAPIEFQGSGSYTDGRVTINTPLVAKQGILVTGSVVAPNGFTGSLYGTASVADGIDVVIAGIYETGSDGVIIPAPFGGYTYISTASYALTASYIASNTWNNLLNIPAGLVSSSVQVFYFPVQTAISSSYALTASYAMNGGGGGAPGSSGTSGTSGTSGSSGTSGQNGTSGTSGTSGSSGTSGTSGVLPAGALSSSQQILNYNIFATTGSNVFVGTQIITGSLIHGLEGNIATGDNSHAEGSITKAIGNYSHAEGDNTQAKGDYSHAEGQETIASGSYSHAEGYQTIALGNNQHVQGQYNATSSVPSAFIVGNGTDDINRSNLIFAVGNEVQIIGNQTVTGSLTVSGSSTFTNIGPAVFSGSVTTTAGVTGSLFGTSSFATTATSASYTLAAALYLLEAYANVTYTLPGTFTEDPCRYSIVNNTVNVPSSWFNTSSYTFTPQKAGYWEIAASYDVYRNAEASLAIKKNNGIIAAAGSFNAVAQQIRKIAYLNGSTDYINIVNVGGAALSRGQFDSRSWFQARWIGE